MDEQQVRALVRQAITRHLGPSVPSDAPAPVAAPHAQLAAPLPAPGAPDAGISHARFHLVRPPAEAECLIEPAVPCNHCGFCQCYGH